ncbi:MAG: lipopolysaccharide heptosyltransferase II [Pseudomonadales bacterium]|jgi:heptosyltransferase-2|nr:lipopolysaccharide heptosyltransferase II [Pseudomonadales bacterium]
MSDTRAILVIGPAWVGDMVMAQVLFRLLKQQQPDVNIDVLAPAWSEPLLARMPEVRASFDLPLKHGEFGFAARKKIGHSLRGKYQQAILLPNSWKSALVPFFADIPLRTGWRGEMRFGLLNDIRTLDKEKHPLMIERFSALAYPQNTVLPAQLPRPHLAIKADELAAALQKYQLSVDAHILALCPGAEFGPAKRWPERHYAAVASQRIEDGEQVWIFGSAKDVPVAEAIRQLLPESQRRHCHVLAGKTSLAEAIDLLSCANAVVTNDSGLMHIAAALNRPLVAVYGSSSPQFTPPLADAVEVVRLGLDCSPCFKRECPLGHLNCLNELLPSRVLDALSNLPQVLKVGV